jgi:hypothetical protein
MVVDLNSIMTKAGDGLAWRKGRDNFSINL